jgi:hypothetical protein
VSDSETYLLGQIERVDPELRGTEIITLTQFLDYHRATLRWKCSGLGDDDLKRRSVPPSTLSLLGLVRHLTEVERNWFGRMLDGQLDAPIYYSDVDPDGDFDGLDSAPVEQVWTTYEATVEESRRFLRPSVIPLIWLEARPAGRATFVGCWFT